MHRNAAHTHRLSCKALGTQACGRSLETKNPLEALVQGEAMLMIWDWQSWFEMDSEQRMLLTVKGLGSRGRSLMWRR